MTRTEFVHQACIHMIDDPYYSHNVLSIIDDAVRMANALEDLDWAFDYDPREQTETNEDEDEKD